MTLRIRIVKNHKVQVKSGISPILLRTESKDIIIFPALRSGDHQAVAIGVHHEG